MSKQRAYETNGESAEERIARRAFRSAMSKGLKRTYDSVTARDVPQDFLSLLELADQKKSKA